MVSTDRHLLSAGDGEVKAWLWAEILKKVRSVELGKGWVARAQRAFDIRCFPPRRAVRSSGDVSPRTGELGPRGQKALGGEGTGSPELTSLSLSQDQPRSA